jgi:hypothetical protein
MRVADGDRGRVPFALVAVLLLLGSATFAASMRGRHPGGADPDAGAAVDRAGSATRTVLTQAVGRAAREAGRDPVLSPANTTYGRVINESTPFRDSLRIRVYLAARRSLAGVSQTVGAVNASASLPPVGNASDLRDAKRRVSIARNGTALEVTVRNVTLTATRNGRTLLSENRTVSVGVDTPVLALHDRTAGFEERLNGPRADVRLSGLLYGIGWTRGYLQYGRVLPIENVVANRHVELAANEVVLSTQRAAFGRADRDGTAALGRGFVQVGLRDVLAGPTAKHPGLKLLLGKRPAPTRTVSPVRVPDFGAPDPSKTVSVGVDETADLALAKLVSGEGGPSLDRLLNRTYGATAKLVTRWEKTHDGLEPPPDPPGLGWRLTGEDYRLSRTVGDAMWPHPAVPANWTGLTPFAREVTADRAVVRTWTSDGVDRTERLRWQDRFSVGFRVVVRHAPSEYAPPRPIDGVHERGGPLNGSNLVGGPAEARSRLVAAHGGRDGVALAAFGEDVEAPIRIERERPGNLTEWVYADLRSLRERVRNVTVEVPRGKLATSVNAPARLRAAIRRNHSTLLDAPERYRSVADKARVAARGAYLERLVSTLSKRAERLNESRSGLDDSLSDHGSSLSEVRSDLRNRDASRVAPGGIRTDDGVVRVTVDGAPSYLPLASVTHDRVRAVDPGVKYHALVARNVNLFTVPYGDAGDTVADATSGGGGGGSGVGLRSAARVLRSAERVLVSANGTDLADHRGTLRTAVNRTIRGRAHWIARWIGGATNLTTVESARAVSEALGTYDGVATRATAVGNGSAAVPISAAVGDRLDLDSMARDRLATKVRLALVRNLSSIRVDAGSVSPVTNATREAAGRLIREGATAGLTNLTERYRGKLADRLDERYDEVLDSYDRKRNPAAVSAGLPLLPTPPAWYVTFNVWVVDVRGQYARFTVRADRGGPEGSVGYTRDGDPVALDVDDDGTAERLGTATRVSFSMSTAVVVAVPPGPNGVGDTNGDMVEASSGWCRPGADDADEEC